MMVRPAVGDSSLEGTDATGSQTNDGMKRWLILGIAAAIIVIAAILLGRFAAEPLQRFAQWVNGLGPWAPVVFILGYALAAVAFFPGSLLTLAAGAIFGLVRGSIYVFVAATLGASLSFLIARYAARPLVRRKLAGDARFEKIDRAVGKEGGKMVLLMRLSPILPYNALNYALGLTKVGFVPFLLGSIGMIPGTILYTYYGKVAGDLTALGRGVRHGPEYYAFLAVGLLATIAVVILGARVGKRALANNDA